MANDKKKMVEAITAHGGRLCPVVHRHLHARPSWSSTASVKGFMMLRPYGYAIWENIQ